MNRWFFLYGLGLLFVIAPYVFISCQKRGAKEVNITVSETHPYFHRRVGGPIDSATANRWHRNLLAKQTSGRLRPVSPIYYLNRAVLKAFTVEPSCVGACFYYGIDEEGKIQIVPIGVDKEGKIIPTATVATTAGIANWEIATKWRMNYQRKNPGSVWGHFWGADAMVTLLEEGGTIVRIRLGLNEKDEQQIFFSNGDVPTTQKEEYDGTSPCPPYCP